MRIKKLLCCLLLVGLCFSVNAQSNEYTWEGLKDHFEYPEWFKKARLGIWLHWGAQSQPEKGGGWYARHMYMEDVKGEDWGANAYSYHLKTYGHPSEKGYKDVIHHWKAEKLDTDALIKYFKDLGAKYFVILANHHDHFDNFDSTHHPWNSVNVGPKRDIVGEFELSAKKYGIPFGVSSHDDRYLDWWLPAFGSDKTGPYANIPYDGHMTKEDGQGKWWEGLDPADLYGLPPAKRTPEWIKETKEHWLLRHKELVTKYDVDLLWFDGFGFPYNEYGKELCTYYYNNRLGIDGKTNGIIVAKIAGDSLIGVDVEMGSADKILPEVWQGTITANTWFYKRDRPLRHSVRTLIEMLIDMNSKNGNMLLNVELMPDGTIPAEHKELLDKFGSWVSLNSEAIYDSQPWLVYGDNLNSIEDRLRNTKNPTETDMLALEQIEKQGASAHFNTRTIESPAFGPQEVRFVTNQGYLYIYVLNPTSGEIGIPALGLRSIYKPEKIKSIQMVGSDQVIKFKQDSEQLILAVPSHRPSEYATAFRVEF